MSAAEQSSIPGLTVEDLSLQTIKANGQLSIFEEEMPIDQLLDEGRNLDLEYQVLRRITETPAHIGRLEEPSSRVIQSKNRYSNILPYQHSRVRLRSGPMDYINANYVVCYTGEPACQFIACQGPVEESIADMWRMVWESESPAVVMLCECVEHDQVRCEQYFPIEAEQPITADDLSVRLVSYSTNDCGSLHTRVLQMTHTPSQSSRTVTHIQFSAWPDYGIPSTEEMSALIQLINQVQAVQVPDSEGKVAPVVTHCSAGVGRTGTFLAAYSLIARYLHQRSVNASSPAKLSVFSTVRRLREQRWGMVQTKEQYRFIYSLLREWLRTHSSLPSPSC
eukprot:GILI01005536.1.p1 GENE.GILI01005536.1~~GILI01005536.1.p1  ORF type:complete len:351 (-),score=92.12 GILI01005536.1:159-1166(-)